MVIYLIDKLHAVVNDVQKISLIFSTRCVTIVFNKLLSIIGCMYGWSREEIEIDCDNFLLQLNWNLWKGIIGIARNVRWRRNDPAQQSSSFVYSLLINLSIEQIFDIDTEVEVLFTTFRFICFPPFSDEIRFSIQKMRFG